MANEIARNPGSSSHRASPTRTSVMQRLGVAQSGFFADWGKRTRSPSYDDDSSIWEPPTTDTNLTNIGDYKGAQIQPLKVPKRKEMSAYQSQYNGSPAYGGGSYTGRTRAALAKTEREVLSGSIKFNIASHPSISTSVLDTMTATSINMDRQMLMWMEDNPSKVLSQAAMEYYKNHPPGGADTVMQTNFENITGQYSETKKMASKKKDYAAAEANKAIQETKKKAVPSAPAYNGAQLNIGKSGGYNSTLYFSPFG